MKSVIEPFCSFIQARMLGSSPLRGLLVLLITSQVSARSNTTASSTHGEKKNGTQERRQNIGKYIYTRVQL